MRRRFFATLKMTIVAAAMLLAAPRASAQFATFDASNLAQAVLIVCYELFAASGSYVPPREKAPPAAQAQKARLAKNWADMLLDIGFMNETQRSHFMHGFQRVFSRGVLTRDDAALLLGVARQARWAAARHPPPENTPHGR